MATEEAQQVSTSAGATEETQQLSTASVAAERWTAAFGGKRKVVLPVIHCEQGDPRRLEEGEELVTWRNVDIALKCGADGVWLINHGFTGEDLTKIVFATRKRYPDLWLGVNWLSSHNGGARIADENLGGVINGLWRDNGHILRTSTGWNTKHAEAELQRIRESGFNGLYFGGVAFKYQQEVAAEDNRECATVASEYMHVICTSGAGTGLAAHRSKVADMHGALTEDADAKLDFQSFQRGPRGKLALASGVTPSNVSQYLPYVDAILVATGVSRDFHNIDPQKLTRLVDLVAAFESSGAGAKKLATVEEVSSAGGGGDDTDEKGEGASAEPLGIYRKDEKLLCELKKGGEHMDWVGVTVVRVLGNEKYDVRFGVETVEKYGFNKRDAQKKLRKDAAKWARVSTLTVDGDELKRDEKNDRDEWDIVQGPGGHVGGDVVVVQPPAAVDPPKYKKGETVQGVLTMNEEEGNNWEEWVDVEIMEVLPDNKYNVSFPEDVIEKYHFKKDPSTGKFVLPMEADELRPKHAEQDAMDVEPSLTLTATGKLTGTGGYNNVA